MAVCMTFFKVFDIPVFWPILLIYFIVLMVSDATLGSDFDLSTVALM